MPFVSSKSLQFYHSLQRKTNTNEAEDRDHKALSKTSFPNPYNDEPWFSWNPGRRPAMICGQNTDIRQPPQAEN